MLPTVYLKTRQHFGLKSGRCKYQSEGIYAIVSELIIQNSNLIES